MTPEQRALMTELKEFLEGIHAGEWNGRPEWRDVLLSRIDVVLASDKEREEMIGGLRGMFSKWLGKRQ